MITKSKKRQEEDIEFFLDSHEKTMELFNKTMELYDDLLKDSYKAQKNLLWIIFILSCYIVATSLIRLFL